MTQIDLTPDEGDALTAALGYLRATLLEKPEVMMLSLRLFKQTDCCRKGAALEVLAEKLRSIHAPASNIGLNPAGCKHPYSPDTCTVCADHGLNNDR